jgi:hypothetical protein
MEETIQKIRTKLQPFIQDFDHENRGNRLSRAIMEGLGKGLEVLIVQLIEEDKHE